MTLFQNQDYIPDRKFYIGTSDYSNRVLRWPKISRAANKLKSVKLKIKLANTDKEFNNFYTNLYSIPKACELKIAEIAGGTEHAVFAGYLQDVSYKDRQCTLTLRDRLWDFTERKIGSSDEPTLTGPYLRGHIEGGSNYLDGVYDIAIMGDHVLATARFSNALAIIDKSDPENLSLTGYVEDAGSNYLLYPLGLDVSSHYAYCAVTSSAALTIIDVSCPSDPSLKGYIAGSSNYLDYARGIAVQSDYAYITCAKAWSQNEKLTVIDVSNPTSPALVRSINGAENYLDGFPDGIAVKGNYAYITNVIRDSLAIFNITNPASLAFTGVISGAAEYLSYPADVKISPNSEYAFVAALTSKALVAIDVSSKASPLRRDQVIGDANYLNEPRRLYITNNFAYITAATGDSLAIFDISNPNSMAPVGYITGSANYLDDVFGVIYDDDYIYVGAVAQDSIASFFSMKEPRLPSDLAWKLITAYGGLDPTQSSTNPDINFESFEVWSETFSSDNILVQANYEGEKVTKALTDIAEMTHSMIWIARDGKLNFKRVIDIAVVDESLFVDANIVKVGINIPTHELVNRQWVNFNYSVAFDYWKNKAYAEDATSINSYGLHENVLESKNVWFSNSASAVDVAMKRIAAMSDPPKIFTIKTPLVGFERDIGDKIRFVDSFYGITSTNWWRASETKFDMANGQMSFVLDGRLSVVGS